jgi:hypothetical protein
MVELHDGPARGSYALRRAPNLMRAVQSSTGKWDCLDQLTDEVEADETVYIYRRVQYNGPVFICGRGPNVPSGRYEQARYVYMADVDAETLGLRDTETWRRWQAEYHGVPWEVASDMIEQQLRTGA